jgi:microcystin degradation protein MlrC
MAHPSSSPRRIFVAGLFHETNTFAEGAMTLADFRVLRGDEMWSALGDASPLGAFLDYAKQAGWQLVHAIDVRATPGPPAEPAVLALFERELEAAALDAHDLDAIFLILHGAMATAECADVEGRVLARIAAHPQLAGLPVFGVLDLHANFSPAMAEHSNALLAYRENPHTDAAETAVRAARLLDQWFADRRPRRTVHVATDIVWPPTGTSTASSPMRDLEQIAREEERDGINAVNVFAGFSHADTPDTGVSYSIVYQPSRVTGARLAEVGERLRRVAGERREQGAPNEWELEAAIDDALEKGLFPTCLVEPADNIGGGTAGDGTAILRALQRRGLRGSGVVLNDPAAVASLRAASVGSTREVAIGGRGFRLDPGPVQLTAKVLRHSDGRFELEDPHSHLASLAGLQIDMGPCTVLESAEGVLILLTSRRTPPMDLGQWRSQGIEPRDLQFIGVKAAVAHRQAYDPIARASYWVRTPGACASDLRTLPYRLIRRPVFPLD